MALRLNPLSTSKGKKHLCELCGKVAIFACQHCRVTYYCSREHQSVDWFGIHERICQLLGALRTLKSTLGSEDERQRRQLTVQMSQHALIDLCKNEAQKHLVQGQYELAIPGALQSLRFSIEVYGAGRIELVPAYLLLAESNLGLRRLRVAEEFLLYANWSVLKNPDCSNELKSQLCRNFGRLYACQERYADALQQLAHDVYYSSLEHGPEHVDTAGGYFYMADVFLMMGEVGNCFAFFDKVVDIWYKFLISLRHRPNESIGDYLSEAHIAEAGEMLRTILDTRRRRLGGLHLATGEAAYALGILKHITGNDAEARHYYSMAHSVYSTQVGPDREATKEVLNALNSIGLGKGASTTAAAAAASATGTSTDSTKQNGMNVETKLEGRTPVPDATPISGAAPSSVSGSHYSAALGNAAAAIAAGQKALQPTTGNAAQSQAHDHGRGGHHGLYADVSEHGIPSNSIDGADLESEGETRRPPMGRRGSSLLSIRGENDGLVEAVTEAEKEAFLLEQRQINREEEGMQKVDRLQSEEDQPSEQNVSATAEDEEDPIDLALRQLPSDLASTLSSIFRQALIQQNGTAQDEEEGTVQQGLLVRFMEAHSPSLGEILSQYPLYQSCFVVEQLQKSPNDVVTWPALVVLFAIEFLLKDIMMQSNSVPTNYYASEDPKVSTESLIPAYANSQALGMLLEQIGYSSDTFLQSLAKTIRQLTVRGVFDLLNSSVDVEQIGNASAEVNDFADEQEDLVSNVDNEDHRLDERFPEPDIARPPSSDAVLGAQSYEV